MNVMRNDKVTLVQEYGNLKKIGETYEVANITDTAVVVRDVNSKIAVAAIDIDLFDTYFQKTITGWTKWTVMYKDFNEVIGYYRTNGKKVQVTSFSGFRGEASCNKIDKFNLITGIRIAYLRAYMKSLNSQYKKTMDLISELNKAKEITNNSIQILTECVVSIGNNTSNLNNEVNNDLS